MEVRLKPWANVVFAGSYQQADGISVGQHSADACFRAVPTFVADEWGIQLGCPPNGIEHDDGLDSESMNLKPWEPTLQQIADELRRAHKGRDRILKAWRAKLESEPFSLRPYQIDEIVRELRNRLPDFIR